jgi:hypothetical protein
LVDALAGDLDETQRRQVDHMQLGAVALNGIVQGIEHFPAVVFLLHVDKVGQDDAADVA